MAKVISGGLKSSYAPSQSQSIKSEPQENLAQYAVRNIAKVPALAYETIRSAGGLADLVDLVEKKYVQPAEQRLGIPKSISEFTSGPFAPRKQAHEEISKVLPKYATEHREGDYPAEFLLTEAPFLAKSVGTAGLKALATRGPGALQAAKNLGKGALTSLGIAGGSEIGGALGREAGAALGDEELGEAVGRLGGGFSGSALTHAGLNRPSKKLPPIESGFEGAKKQQINDIKTEISDYKNNIKSIDKTRHELYNAASKLEGNAAGNASIVNNAINAVKDDIKKGVGLSDQKSIRHNISALEHAIKNNTLSLSDAKKIQKNFNDQIYNYGASNSFKRQMNELTQSLNKFIEQTGTLEHTQNWKQAEAAHKEFKTLQKEQKEFIKDRNQEIREIHKAKPDQIAQIGEAIKKQASKWGIATTASALSYIFGGGKTTSALAGLGVKLGQGLKNEVEIAANAFKEHPELFNDLMKTLSGNVKKDLPKIINRVNEIGSFVEEYSNNQENKQETKSQPKIIRGGLKH